jgi:hypothetical protein
MWKYGLVAAAATAGLSYHVYKEDVAHKKALELQKTRKMLAIKAAFDIVENDYDEVMRSYDAKMQVVYSDVDRANRRKTANHAPLLSLCAYSAPESLEDRRKAYDRIVQKKQ